MSKQNEQTLQLETELEQNWFIDEPEQEKEESLENYIYDEKLVPMYCRAGHKVGSYLKETAIEKIEMFTNPKKFYNEMKELMVKEGLPFAIYAATVEIVEDGVLPIVLAATGNEEYIPIVLIGHSEPVMYPLYFGVRKLYRHFKGKSSEAEPVTEPVVQPQLEPAYASATITPLFKIKLQNEQGPDKEPNNQVKIPEQAAEMYASKQMAA